MLGERRVSDSDHLSVPIVSECKCVECNNWLISRYSMPIGPDVVWDNRSRRERKRHSIRDRLKELQQVDQTVSILR